MRDSLPSALRGGGFCVASGRLQALSPVNDNFSGG